jgi:hypothetical protein
MAWLGYKLKGRPSLSTFNAYLLTACRIVLEKLTSSQLNKKFPAFYGTQQFKLPVTHNAKQAQYMEMQQDVMFLVSLSP